MHAFRSVPLVMATIIAASLNPASVALADDGAVRLEVRDATGWSWSADALGLRPGDEIVRYLDVISERGGESWIAGELEGRGGLTAAGGLSAGVEECPAGWGGGDCPSGRESLAPEGSSLRERVPIPGKKMAARSARHLKISVRVVDPLPEEAFGAQSRLVLKMRAVSGSGHRNGTAADSGSGEKADRGSGEKADRATGLDSRRGPSGLAATGAETVWVALSALALIFVGVGLLEAMSRRRETVRRKHASASASDDDASDDDA